jgi:DNA-binding transcriptional ArsR family regulator
MSMETEEITLSNWRALFNETRRKMNHATREYERIKKTRDDIIVKADIDGETQRDIARILDVSQSTISYVLRKNGRRGDRSRTTFARYLQLVERYNKCGSFAEVADAFGVSEELVRNTITYYEKLKDTGCLS